MRIAPGTQTWFEQWAVDGLWFTRDHAWYSFFRPVDLDFDAESFSSVAAECIPSVFASAGSYSLGVTNPDSESLTDSFSEVSCTFTYSENLSLALRTDSVLKANAVAEVAAFNVEANADSYSLGVTDPETESLVDSFSQTTAQPVVAVEANAESYSLGITGTGNEALADSFSEIDCVATASVANTAFGVTTSKSTVTGQVTAEIFIKADAQSYSFGVGDTDTESLTDSFSQTTAAVTDVAVSRAGSTASTSVLNVDSGSSSATSGTATGTSRSVSTVTGQVAVTVSVRADTQSYSFGVGDTDTDSLTDSFSQTTAAVTDVAVSRAGTSASVSTPAVTSGSVLVASRAGTSASVSAPAVVTGGATLAASGSGTSASVSRVTGQAAAVEFSVRADTQSYSFGVGDTDTDSLTDSFSQTTAAVTVVMAYSGTTTSKSTTAVTGTNVIVANVSGTTASKSTPAVTSTNVVVAAASGTTASKSTPAVTSTNVVVANVSGTTASKSTTAVTGTNVLLANVSGTTASKSTAAVTSTNVVVANVSGTTASKSTTAVTGTNVVVASFTGTTASRSTTAVTSANVVVASASGTTASKSTLAATTTFVPTMTIRVTAVSHDAITAQQRYWQRQQISTAGTGTYEIPPWVEWIDELALGGGAGSTGSVAVGPGRGGQGGTWAVRENAVATLLSSAGITATPSRMYANVTVGNGGNGGPYNALAYQVGQSGGASRVQLFAVDSGTTKQLTTILSGAGGAAATGGAVAVNTATRPGGAAQGGNTSSGRDYRITRDPGYTYVGGAANGSATALGTTASGGTPGNPPGGGAGGNVNGAAGHRGADGSVWLRFDSEVYGVIGQQQFVTPGSGEFDLPVGKTSLVQAVVVGAGAGGDGGNQLLNGAAGQGGRWATYAAPWDIESLLPSGVTQSSITRLWVEWTVGQGGAGGAATITGTNIVGGKGGASTVTLKCRTATNTYTLGATRTGIGGNPGTGLGGANDQDGLGVTGGNLNSGRDMFFAVNGKQFTFKGGAPLPEFGLITIFNRPLSVGNAPGGGGDGGTGGGLSTPLAGMRGAHGGVYLVYVYTPIVKTDEEELDESDEDVEEIP